MRQISSRPLWVGHAGDTRDCRPLFAAGIRAVVELADSEPLATLAREFIRCRFPLADGGGNPPWLMRLAVESIATLLRAGVPTLVACGCGLSRSVCVAAGSLGPGRRTHAARRSPGYLRVGASRRLAGIAVRGADGPGRNRRKAVSNLFLIRPGAYADSGSKRAGTPPQRGYGRVSASVGENILQKSI